MIQSLKEKLIRKQKQKQTQQQQQQQEATITRNKWIAFTYFSPLVRRITNLFKQTKLKIAFRATNTIQQQLSGKQSHVDPSGIYKLKCSTCNKVYVGQSGRAISVRFKEHIRYQSQTTQHQHLPHIS
jgi:hypothetical protein